MNRLLCTVTTDDYGVPDTPVSKRGLDLHPLEERGPPRGFKWTTLGGFPMETASRRYGGPAEYMRLLSLRLAGLSEHYYAMRERECERRRVARFRIVTEQPPENTDVEHSLPASLFFFLFLLFPPTCLLPLVFLLISFLVLFLTFYLVSSSSSSSSNSSSS